MSLTEEEFNSITLEAKLYLIFETLIECRDRIRKVEKKE